MNYTTDSNGTVTLSNESGIIKITPTLSGYTFSPSYVIITPSSQTNYTVKFIATYTITAVLIDSKTGAYLNGSITCNGQTYNSDTSALHTITIKNLSGNVNFTAYSAGYNSVTGTFNPSESGQQLVKITMTAKTYTITAVLIDSKTNAYLNGYITCNGQTYYSNTSSSPTITIPNLSGNVNFTAYSVGYNSVTGTFNPSEGGGQQLVTITMSAYIYNVVIDFVNANSSAATLTNTNVNINITPD